MGKRFRNESTRSIAEELRGTPILITPPAPASTNPFDTFSDEQMKMELTRREERRKQERLDKIQVIQEAQKDFIQKHPIFVELFAPTHTGRCDDRNIYRENGWALEGQSTAPRCKRCALLELAEANKLADMWQFVLTIDFDIP